MSATAESLPIAVDDDEIDWSMLFGSVTVVHPASSAEMRARMANDARLWRRSCDEVGLERLPVTRGAPCSFDECDRPAKRLGLCQTHYEYKRTGKSLVEIVPKVRQPCTATFAGEKCGSLAIALDLCRTHYMRQERGIPLDAPKLRGAKRKKCSHKKCQRLALPRNSIGHCRFHARRQESGIPLDQRVISARPAVCKECNQPGKAQELCGKHYWLLVTKPRRKQPR